MKQTLEANATSKKLAAVRPLDGDNQHRIEFRTCETTLVGPNLNLMIVFIAIIAVVYTWASPRICHMNFITFVAIRLLTSTTENLSRGSAVRRVNSLLFFLSNVCRSNDCYDLISVLPIGAVWLLQSGKLKENIHYYFIIYLSLCSLVAEWVAVIAMPMSAILSAIE